MWQGEPAVQAVLLSFLAFPALQWQAGEQCMETGQAGAVCCTSRQLVAGTSAGAAQGRQTAELPRSAQRGGEQEVLQRRRCCSAVLQVGTALQHCTVGKH